MFVRLHNYHLFYYFTTEMPRVAITDYREHYRENKDGKMVWQVPRDIDDDEEVAPVCGFATVWKYILFQ